MTSNPPTSYARCWDAKLDLKFEHKNGNTVLTGKKHSGPLLVQKPFYPEHGECCHVYIIHPPAGIVGGDTLSINASLTPYSHALITTPAATKFYKSNDHIACQTQLISLSENSTIEWLPQETIYFNGTQAQTKTRINIEDKCRFIAWEIQCMGQPSSQEKFDTGSCTQKFEIWKKNKPIFLECNRITGGEKILHSPWGLNNHEAIGSLVFSTHEQADLLGLLKNSVKTDDRITAGFTDLNNLIVVRAMARYAEQIKELFTFIWQLIRPYILERQACPPRIWQT